MNGLVADWRQTLFRLEYGGVLRTMLFQYSLGMACLREERESDCAAAGNAKRLGQLASLQNLSFRARQLRPRGGHGPPRQGEQLRSALLDFASRWGEAVEAQPWAALSGGAPLGEAARLGAKGLWPRAFESWCAAKAVQPRCEVVQALAMLLWLGLLDELRFSESPLELPELGLCAAVAEGAADYWALLRGAQKSKVDSTKN